MRINAPLAQWSARRSILLGWAAIAIMLAGLAFWGFGVRIAGAIVVTGTVRVEADRQIIQHPSGGVVGQIAARDGHVVQKGDVLIRFDDNLLQTELAIVDRQLLEILVRKIRLRGERDAAVHLDFAQTANFAHLDRAWVQGQIRGQTDLFVARKSSLSSEIEHIGEQRAQIKNQIKGMQAQTLALTTQWDLLKLELQAQQELLERGLIPLARVLAMQRELAGTEGEIGRLNAAVAEAAGRMSVLSIARVQLSDRRREDAITRLRDLRYSEIELVGKKNRLNEQLGRMVVRAPLDGTVFGSRVSSLQSVVRPAEPIMFIEPADHNLQVMARISPSQIDEIYDGQSVTLRFPALDPLTSPPVFGQVIRLSPDTLQDEATGLPYYKAIIIPKESELAHLMDQRILPGMPVEAFIKTTERTPISYLTQPLSGYFRRAFREG